MPGESLLSPRPGSPFNVDENVGKRDKNFRKYASAVERALSLFETTLQEWADYISFLGRLLKALQASPADVHEIPYSRLVSKRLAQCLNPSLPSGVHQKALEAYAVCFSTLGRDGLGAALPLFLPGLSPLLSFASSSVKPLLLNLFETFILDLKLEVLKPALKAIILSLLPGLEEPSSEEFTRTHDLVNGFRKACVQKQDSGKVHQEAADDRFFWQSLFIASISNSFRRTGALVYLEHNLPLLNGRYISAKALPITDSGEGRPAFNIDDTVEAVICPEPGLLIRSFAAGLQDEQLLVQRGYLELLVTRLPLSSPVLQQRVGKADREMLVAAAISVVLRREMSLNRRLWLWFLGQATSSDQEQSEPSSPQIDGSNKGEQGDRVSGVDHFKEYGLESVVQGLLKAFRTNALTSTSAARPFRICLSLMDRWEIGGLILPQIFKPAMESVYGYEKSAPSEVDFQEVLRSANVFFDAIQSRLIWKEIIALVTNASRKSAEQEMGGEKSMDASMDLVAFIVRNFNVQEEEMLTIHIPNAIYLLLHHANSVFQDIERIQSERNTILLGSILDTAILLFNELPDHLIPKVLLRNASQDVTHSMNDTKDSQQTLLTIQEFYAADDNLPSQAKDHGPLFSPERNFVSLISSLIGSCASQAVLLTAQLKSALILLARLVQTSSKPTILTLTPLLTSIENALHDLAWGYGSGFEGLDNILSCYEILQQAMSQDEWQSNVQVRSATTTFVRKLWKYVSPVEVQYNVDAVHCMWRIHHLTQHGILETAVVNLLYEDKEGQIHDEVTVEGVRHFTTLWAQSVTPSRSTIRSFSSTSKVQPTGPDRSLDVQYDPAALGKPLILILDILKDSSSRLHYFVHGWLRSLTSLDMIFNQLIHQSRETLRPYFAPEAIQEREILSATDKSMVGECTDELMYWLRTFSSICAVDSPYANSALQSTSWDGERSISEGRKIPQRTSLSSNQIANQTLTLQEHLIHVCTSILQKALSPHLETPEALCEACLDLLRQIFVVGDIAALNAGYTEKVLFDCLKLAIERANIQLQVVLMVTIKELLRKKPLPAEHAGLTLTEPQNVDVSESKDRIEKQHDVESMNIDPSSCLMLGFRSTHNYSVLEDWIDFQEVVFIHYPSAFFEAVVPLVECLCQSIRSLFEDLQCSFQRSRTKSMTSEPVQAMNLLFNALEFVLSKGHGQTIFAESKRARTPEPTQGYLGNMVTGLFAGEAQTPRPATADDRRGVLYGFREALRTAYNIWAWKAVEDHSPAFQGAVSASFQYVSIRLRNRTRRVLENLLNVEPLECLEVLIQHWKSETADSGSVMDILNALEATRPKNTMPAIFNSLYSRTNPVVLENYRQSTFASELSEIEIAAFLVTYTRSMDDDALDEVWIDCMTFAKDVLANPMPQRHILPLLLEFIAVLGQKIDNTNFGDLRKMRREIADLFARLLAAMFTIKPLSFANEDNQVQQESSSSVPLKNGKRIISTEIIPILNAVLPQMMKILIDTDRLSVTASTVSLQILMPSFHWKHFPRNMNASTVELMQTFSRVKEISKIWKKDVAEAFNDPKFFARQPFDLVSSGWMPLLRQWTLSDSDRMPEMITRLSSPTSAGIMFGVGASSARREADRKSQVNLRRIALLLLSADEDFFVPSAKVLQDKLVELLNATPSSSPSSATRAEIYMVLRALLLKISPVHLTSLWPIINAELHDALASIGRIASRETYTITNIVQAAKLLDTLLLLGPDEFQLREWLFVTDTVEAVYRPPAWRPVALTDELVEILDQEANATPSGIAQSAKMTYTAASERKPLLQWEQIHHVPRENILEQVLKPFLRQLSIQTFESMYAMANPDVKSCRTELVKDLFDDSTLD